MPNPIVTSPAGDEIELIPRKQWAAITNTAGAGPLSQQLRLSDDRRALALALWHHGAFTDPSGMATRLLAEEATKHKGEEITPNLTMMLASPVLGRCVERELKPPAKKTYGIKLVALPQTWFDELALGTKPEPTPLPEPAPVELDDVTPQVVEVEIANAVATALLSQVATIISTGNGHAPDLAHAQAEIVALTERLGSQTTYVETLRRQARDAADQIQALMHERDGLRARLRTAEHNLKAATSADAQKIIDAEVHRQVDIMMRQAPGRGHEKDPKVRAS